jgi:hypothetical protein
MSDYSSKYKMGQEVYLKSPFSEGVKGVIDGIRFDSSTIRYDVAVNEEYNIERIYPDLLLGTPNVTTYPDALAIDDEEYYLIIENNVIKNCRILGMVVYGDDTYRYKVGMKNTKDVINDVNPRLIFKKEDAIVYIRDTKIETLIK